MSASAKQHEILVVDDRAENCALADTKLAVVISSRKLEHAVELRVRGSGGGVATELRERVPQPYEQLARSSQPAARTGRGLALTFCEVALQAHGGSIWIEDAEPGAASSLRFPNA